MGVTGDTTLSSDLTVAGTTNLKDTNVDGSLSVAKDLTVTGDQTIGGLGVTGDDAEQRPDGCWHHQLKDTNVDGSLSVAKDLTMAIRRSAELGNYHR